MKKILFVTSKSLGGSGKYISSLASALRDKGYHCELIYFPMGVIQDVEIEGAFSTVHHFRVSPNFSPINIVKNIAQIKSVVDSQSFDWVHTHTSLGGLIGKIGAALSRRSVTIGATLHAFAADEFTPVPQKWFFWVIERFLDLLTHAYVSPSHYMVKYGKRIHVINTDKVTVIHNSLPLPPPPMHRADLYAAKRAELKVSSDEIVFLFCGRLEQQKGADILLAAFARLPADLRCKLVICGIGEDENRLRQQAEGLGISSRVLWLGWQSDLTPFYASADIYVMPSRWESFGLVFLEAMNFSLPVISTLTQAVPEVVANGQTGLLSVNGDIAALALNMAKLARDPSLRAQMGKEGKIRLNEYFTFERFVDEHIDWYENSARSVSSKKRVTDSIDCYYR